MTTRDMTTMTEQLRLRLGGITTAAAEHSLWAVVDAIGEALTRDEARALAVHLPEQLSDLVRNAARRERRGESLEEIVDGVSWRENVDASKAREVLVAVCGVLADDIPDEVGKKLRADLPPSLATLIASRPPAIRLEERVVPPRPAGIHVGDGPSRNLATHQRSAAGDRPHAFRRSERRPPRREQAVQRSLTAIRSLRSQGLLPRPSCQVDADVERRLDVERLDECQQLVRWTMKSQRGWSARRI